MASGQQVPPVGFTTIQGHVALPAGITLPTDAFIDHTWPVEQHNRVPQGYGFLPSHAQRAIQASPYEISIMAGMACTPAAQPGDLRAVGFALTYAPAFEAPPARIELKVRRGSLGSDARFKAVFAEVMGAGIAWLAVHRLHDVVFAGDVMPLINSGDLAYVQQRAGRGARRRCDYVGLTSNPAEVVLFEAKGVVGAYGSLRGKVTDGLEQVDNVDPVSWPLRASEGRLVIGTHFGVLQPPGGGP